jgi:GNAT superfamily N-acetyltransferase
MVRSGNGSRNPETVRWGMGNESMTIPVQRLGAIAATQYLDHLLALPPEDARLRFGSAISAETIRKYVEGIDFDSDEVFGVHGDGLTLVGAAHLAFNGDEAAELGVSVLPQQRGRGIGKALVARAAEHARNRKVRQLFMHCLAENAAMIHIARRASMDVVIDSGDADAHVALPPADSRSIQSEFLAERVALYDFALKSQVETMRRIGLALVRAGSK